MALINGAGQKSRKRFPAELLPGILVFLLFSFFSFLQYQITYSGHPTPFVAPDVFGPVHAYRARTMAQMFPQFTANYDLLCYESRFRFFGSDKFFSFDGQVFNYPAPIAVVFSLLYRSSAGPVSIYKYALIFWVILGVAAFVYACVRRGTRWYTAAIGSLLVVFTSFPFLFMFFLHNLELLVWIVLGTGIWAFYTGKHWLAAVCFGLAGSFKYFPLAFLFSFPFRKEWKQIFVGASVFGLSMIGSLWIMGPTIKTAAAGLRQQTGVFAEQYLYVWRPAEGAVDHSAFAALKLILLETHHAASIHAALRPYLLTVFILAGSLYLLRIRKMSSLSQLLLISVASVWLMPLSHDYTLVNLFIPCALLVLYALDRPDDLPTTRKSTVDYYLAGAFVCFGIIFSWLTFVHHGSVHYGGQCRCLVLTVLFCLLLRKDFTGGAELSAFRKSGE